MQERDLGVSLNEETTDFELARLSTHGRKKQMGYVYFEAVS